MREVAQNLVVLLINAQGVLVAFDRLIIVQICPVYQSASNRRIDRQPLSSMFVLMTEGLVQALRLASRYLQHTGCRRSCVPHPNTCQVTWLLRLFLIPFPGQVKGLLLLGRVLAADNQPLHHGHAIAMILPGGLAGGVFSIKAGSLVLWHDARNGGRAVGSGCVEDIPSWRGSLHGLGTS